MRASQLKFNVLRTELDHLEQRIQDAAVTAVTEIVENADRENVKPSKLNIQTGLVGRFFFGTCRST